MNKSPDSQFDADVIIIGAGIIGICAAANLAEAGRSVVVIDRTGICEETSSAMPALSPSPTFCRSRRRA